MHKKLLKNTGKQKKIVQNLASCKVSAGNPGNPCKHWTLWAPVSSSELPLRVCMWSITATSDVAGAPATATFEARLHALAQLSTAWRHDALWGCICIPLRESGATKAWVVWRQAKDRQEIISGWGGRADWGGGGRSVIALFHSKV